MSYYYQQPTPPPPGPPPPSYYVGDVINESISGNVDNYQYFNVDSQGAPVTNGQIFSFSFTIKEANLYGDPNARHALVTGARILIYKDYIGPTTGGIVGYVDVPNFLDVDNSPPQEQGYGTFNCRLNATTLTIGGYSSQIVWYPGSSLLPSTFYLLRVSYRANEYNQSGSYHTTSYSSFTTLGTAPPIPPSYHPFVNNGHFEDMILDPTVIVTDTTANLTNFYTYQNQPSSGDSPSVVGFKYRVVGTTAWISIAEIPTFIFGFGPLNAMNTDITITGLSPATTYEYISYVRDNNGITYYSSDTPFLTNIVSAKKTPFTTLSVSINSWIDPNPSSTGRWYQLYNDWELVTTPDANNTIVPFFRVRQYNPSITSALIHNNLERNFSLFYYLNKIFTKDKNYQFRTIVENFYTITGNTDINKSKNSNFSIRTPWGEIVNLSAAVPYFPLTSIPNSLKVINLYLYTNINSFDPTISGITKQKPIDLIESKSNPQNPVAYISNAYFNGNTTITTNFNTYNSLLDVNISDIDWIIQGYAPFNINNNTGNTLQTNTDEVIPLIVNGEAIGGKGWHFLENRGRFVWFDKYNYANTDENKNNLPVGGDINNYYYGKTPNEKYLVDNYISRYISYQKFNISFDYVNNTNFELSMYIGSIPSFELQNQGSYLKYNLDKLISDGYTKKITTFGKSNIGAIPGTTQSCEFIGVDGNQYLFFVATPVYEHLDSNNFLIPTSQQTYKSTINGINLTSTTYSVITLENFKISGAYNSSNNDNFNISTTQSYSTIYPILNATYSIKLGSGDNVIPGSINNVVTVNSLAGNGRFNSGIWENGVWNNGWREDLTRRDFYKIDQFYSYDKDKKWRVRVSGPISSIPAFTIGDKVSISNIVAIDINEERKLLKKYYTIVDIGTNFIEVEFENDFPLRRIEMDSDEHRIYVSKNVWLSGVFLNGYFKGIWNSGLFSGYPLITKMDESHWIDGIFNGGHFTANKYGVSFSTIFPTNLDGVTRLGLSFSTPHNLTIDDIISINPNTYTALGYSTNKSIGTTVVSEVIDEHRLTTGITWKTDYVDVKNGGVVKSIISTGLVQNFDFYSNNVSSVTSLQSLRSERVFSYNSWIDVNYSNQSAVNIGKPQSILEGDTKRSYSENNLYGYPTNDVLSSTSVFRDSFSTSLRRYKLGKKYKIFNDYIGDSSSFEEYFDSSDTTAGIDAFNTQGWDILVSSDNILELRPISLNYTPDYTTNYTTSMTMSFYNDVTYILPEVVKVYGKSFFAISGQTTYSYIDYLSSATISHVDYDSTTNKTEILLLPDSPIWKIVNNTDYYIPSSHASDFYISFERSNGLTFSRTPEPLNSNSPTIGKELKVNTINKGGYLNLIPAYDVLNRTNGTNTQTLEKSRYTLVEFDLIDYISATNSYLDPNTGYRQPSIHFNNLNYIKRNVIVNSATQSLTLPATYLPINKNINHILTRGKKKQEFFFNKRNLLMNFNGTGVAGSEDTEYYLDNIKFYQIDMIPFFQYFISPIGAQGNINKSVQIPNNGTSPVIEFVDDAIIDSNNDNNDIITFFSNNLIASNIEIPAGINWQRDYSIYRTQISGNDILGNNDMYIED
jgi:hypothetical protein